METNKIIDRIVRELTKGDSAQEIIDKCQADLLDYYYWEYKELEWEHIGFLTKANTHLRMALQTLKERGEIIKEQNDIIRGWEIKYNDHLKIFADAVLLTHELAEEQTRQEMLLNLKEQHGISST